MSTQRKILLLLLLLIIFISACVYMKIDYFVDKFTSTVEIVEQQDDLPSQKDNEEIESVDLVEENTIKVPISNQDRLIEVNEDEEKKLLENKDIQTEIIEVQQPIEESIEEITNTNEEIQEEINSILKDNGIIFQRMSFNVSPKSMDTIDKIVEIIKLNPSIKIEIAGHTDAKGETNFNKTISEQRANSVMALLIEKGIPKERLVAVGYGEDKPLVENDKDGYSLINRRVEFNIIEE